MAKYFSFILSLYALPVEKYFAWWSPFYFMASCGPRRRVGFSPVVLDSLCETATPCAGKQRRGDIPICIMLLRTRENKFH